MVSLSFLETAIINLSDCQSQTLRSCPYICTLGMALMITTMGPGEYHARSGARDILTCPCSLFFFSCLTPFCSFSLNGGAHRLSLLQRLLEALDLFEQCRLRCRWQWHLSRQRQGGRSCLFGRKHRGRNGLVVWQNKGRPKELDTWAWNGSRLPNKSWCGFHGIFPPANVEAT